MDVFKTLTCGVIFKNNQQLKKRNEVSKQETIKVEPDDENIEATKRKRKKLSTEYLKQKGQEEVNRIRKEHHINVKGNFSCSKPIETFDELFTRYSLDDQLVQNFKDFQYKKPTAVQMQVLPLFLEQKELKVCAQTGSGKTMAFVFPLIQNLINNNETDSIKAIILVPTRELAMQILSVSVRLCQKTNVRAHIITSTNEEHMKNFHKKKTNILITTPLKLVHFIKNSKVGLEHVEYFVIDEVDKLFEESNQSFKEDLDTILEACKNPNRKFALFSATNVMQMTKWVHENLKDFVTINILPNVPISSIQQELKYVGTESAKLLAIREIFREGIMPPVLIFLQSKDRAKQLHSELIYDGLNIDIIHSDRSQKEREDVYRKFREGKIWVLICTELMSRGIDFRDISMVVNFDLPSSTVSYVHRVGRCGRAGKTGRAITLYTNDDQKGILRDIAKLVEKSGSKVESYLLQLKKSSKKQRLELLKKAPKRKRISNKLDRVSKKRKFKKKKVVKVD